MKTIFRRVYIAKEQSTKEDEPMKISLKKMLTALAVALLLTLLAGTALAASFGVVSGTNNLNLRSQGSSSSRWLGSYPRGTWVEITGSQNNFYRVITPDGKTGYMSKNFIDDSGEDWYGDRIGVVNNHNGGAFLNFRQQPSYSAKVLGIFYNGVPLKILGDYEGWYLVEINGQAGYVRQEFVSVINMAGSSSVATIKTPNNTALNLRQGPGMNYPVLRQFYGDQYVMVLAEGNGWWRVAVTDGYNRSVGFMDSSFLVKGLNGSKDISASNGTGAVADSYAVVSNPKSTQTLNLRQHASTASVALTQLTNGTRLWVEEQGSEWCRVTVQQTGQSGYVMTRYISLHNLPRTPSRKVVHPAGSFVNLRQGPDMNYGQVLVRVPSGKKVTILTPGLDWCKVSYGGTTGYMMSCFLQQ